MITLILESLMYMLFSIIFVYGMGVSIFLSFFSKLHYPYTHTHHHNGIMVNHILENLIVYCVWFPHKLHTVDLGAPITSLHERGKHIHMIAGLLVGLFMA